LITYTSESLALASLEVLVHCDIDLVPSDLVAIEFHVPASVKTNELATSNLPRDWRRSPASAATQRLGNAWLDGTESCVLQVPSAIIPSESNFLINPSHPDIRRIRVVTRRRFRFDPRLIAG
jgi:RES domain-containing protein